MQGGFGFESSSGGEVPASGRVGPWELVRLLGQGGMGAVHEARDATGQRVALKLLLPGATERHLQRFRREAAALARLRHPNLPTLVARGEDAAAGPWLAMQLIEGRNLGSLLAAGRPAPLEVARVGAEVASALGALHAQGVVHRDVKPGNVMVTAAGRVVLVDLGVALLPEMTRMTVSGAFVGTPSCAAPEQLQDPHRAGAPADVWGLGVVLCLALSGRAPGDVGPQALPALLQGAPPPLAELTLACLRPRPEERPRAPALAGALRAVAAGRAPPPWDRPRRLPIPAVLAGLVACAGLAAGGLLWSSSPSAAAPPAAPPTAAGWSLGAGPAPELRPPQAWREGGRLADPLSLEALQAHPGASAEPLPDGRLRLAWSDPATALRPRVARLEEAWRAGGLPSLARPAPDRVTVAVLGESADVILDLPGRWSRPQLEAEVRLAAGGDARAVTVACAPAGRPSETCYARLDARSKQLRLDDGSGQGVASARWEPGPERSSVRWDTAAGELVVGGTTLRGAPARESGASQLSLACTEAELELGGLAVTGVLTRPPAPALALVPLEAGPRWTLRARFEVKGEGAGGPLLGLWSGAGATITVELDGRRWLARQGARTLASQDLEAPVRRGTLELTREVDLLRARVLVEGGAPCELRVPLPEPLGRPLQAAFGSGAPLVLFQEVVFEPGPSEPTRAAFDADRRAGGDPEDPGGAWRRAAWTLAGLTLPGARGAGEDPLARARTADAVARELAGLAPRLSAELRADALARACWAAALSGERELLAGLLDRLAAACGGEAQARAAVDGLWRNDDGGLLRQLARAWPQLVPGEPAQECRARVRVALLDLLERLADPGDAAERELLALERARLVARARGAMPEGAWQDEARRALARLGELARARPSGGSPPSRGRCASSWARPS